MLLRLLYQLLSMTGIPRLLFRLMMDRRVPLHTKLIPVAGLAYLISPWDLLPDNMVPVFGRFDDILVIVLSIALFLVLSVPMTISPVLAVMHIHRAQTANLDFTTPLVIWLVVLFVFAAIFHLWGTRLLLEMHNGHLRIEELNQQVLTETSPWLPERTPAVLDERPEGAQPEGPGELPAGTWSTARSARTRSS